MSSLIGRGREMARITAQLAEIHAGRGAALMVQGEAGIGKTALLDYAADVAAGMRVLRVVGIESEAEVAFAALRSRTCSPNRATPTAGPGTSRPRSAAPTRRPRPGWSGRPNDPPAAVDRRRPPARWNGPPS
jgi:AAA ATPase domain